MHRLLPFFATTNNVSLMALVFGSYNEAKLFLSWSLELKLTGHRVYTSQSHPILLNCSPSFGANCIPSFSPSIVLSVIFWQSDECQICITLNSAFPWLFKRLSLFYLIIGHLVVLVHELPFHIFQFLYLFFLYDLRALYIPWVLEQLSFVKRKFKYLCDPISMRFI